MRFIGNKIKVKRLLCGIIRSTTKKLIRNNFSARLLLTVDIVVDMVVGFIKDEVMKKIIIDGKEKNEEKTFGQHNIYL